MRYIIKVRGIPPRKWLFFQACSFFLHGRIGGRGAGGQSRSPPTRVEAAGGWESPQPKNHCGPNWQKLLEKQVPHLCNCL